MGLDGLVRRWPLTGFWRAWLGVSAALGAALLAGGAVMCAFALLGAGPLVVLPGLVLLAVGTVITWQVANTATEVALGADGALVLRRPRGPLRTSAARVTRARPSLLRSSRTPTVLETADGWAYLVHDGRTRQEILGALADRHTGRPSER